MTLYDDKGFYVKKTMLNKYINKEAAVDKEFTPTRISKMLTSKGFETLNSTSIGKRTIRPLFISREDFDKIKQEYS